MKGRTDCKPGPSLLISGYDSAIEAVNEAGVIGAREFPTKTLPHMQTGVQPKVVREPWAVRGRPVSVTTDIMPHIRSLGGLRAEVIDLVTGN